MVSFDNNETKYLLQFNENFCFSLVLKRFPFDSNAPIGYLLAIIFEYGTAAGAYYMISCTLALGIGAFWFIISVIKDIQHILHLINKEAHAKKQQPKEMKMLFLEYIRAHGIVKQLSSISQT